MMNVHVHGIAFKALDFSGHTLLIAMRFGMRVRWRKHFEPLLPVGREFELLKLVC